MDLKLFVNSEGILWSKELSTLVEQGVSHIVLWTFLLYHFIQWNENIFKLMVFAEFFKIRLQK